MNSSFIYFYHLQKDTKR